MPRAPTRDRSGQSIELKPIGGGGLDLNTAPAMLSPDTMRQARNIMTYQKEYARRLGDRKLCQLEDKAADYGSKVFGTVAKYARFTPPPIPKGGYHLHFHFNAARPVSGTSYLWSSWVSHAQYGNIGVVWATLSSTGDLVVKTNWEGGSSTPDSITVSALTANRDYHGLIVYDDYGGTWSLYLDGVLSGTPVTVGSELQPRQDVNVSWYVGGSFDPGVAMTAGTSFVGAIDALSCHTTSGINITNEDTEAVPPRKSLLWHLLRWNWQDHPNPASIACLWHYGMDEATAGTGSMYDSSDRRNHGTYFGSPTNASRIALRAQNGNFIGTTRRAALGSLSDGRVNLVIAAGDHYYETLRTGV